MRRGQKVRLENRIDDNRNVYDLGSGYVRARYLGEKGGREGNPCWLVYGLDGDAVGAITEERLLFVAHKERNEVGRRVDIRDAICLILDKETSKRFRGEK